jgi:hypothetical protein
MADRYGVKLRLRRQYPVLGNIPTHGRPELYRMIPEHAFAQGWASSWALLGVEDLQAAHKRRA